MLRRNKQDARYEFPLFFSVFPFMLIFLSLFTAGLYTKTGLRVFGVATGYHALGLDFLYFF